MSHTTTRPVEDLLGRIRAALTAHDAAVPEGEEPQDELRAALQDLAEILTRPESADEPVYVATVRALLASPPGAVTLLAGHEPDVHRLAKVLYGLDELNNAQLARTRRWLATLAEQGAHDGQ